jgi:hypothetical protein
MKRLLLMSVAAIMLTAVQAKADALNNLSISALPNPVPQSQSNPCIICGTNAAGQPGNFGYNNFTSNGNLTSYNMFSTNIIGGGVLANGDQVDALPYSGALLEGLQAAGLTFGVAIDINTAQNQETLTAFRLIDLSKPAGQRVIYDFTGSLALPDINNGNGKGDYLITGFDLLAAGVSPGDALIFQATWQNASDGAESFYIVPGLQVATPLPATVWMFAAGLGGLGLLTRRRKRLTATQAAA